MHVEELRVHICRTGHFSYENTPKSATRSNINKYCPTHTISGRELCQPMLVTVIYHHGSEDRSYDGQVAEKHENDDEDYCDDVGVGVVMIRRPGHSQSELKDNLH